MNLLFFSFPQIQPVCNWNQTAKLKENYLQSWSFNFGLSDLNTEFGRRQRGSRQRGAVRTDEGKICSSLSIWVKRGSILWNNWNVALPEPRDHIHWRVVHLMAATDPESLIQVLSVGVEGDKEFPRTIHHLRHMGCISFSMAGTEDLRLILSQNSHGQSTNIPASENPSFFGHSEPQGSLCSGSGRGEECGSSWQSEDDFTLCSCGGKCPWSLWRARNSTVTNTWPRNSGWILQCGEEHQGGLLRWMGPLSCLFPGKPFQGPHSSILLPKMWGHKAHTCPEQSFPTPPLLP